MAFHQPTRQTTHRSARVDPTLADSEAHAPALRLTQSRDESQTWVLFSPDTDAGTTTSYISSVQDEQATPGRSRISDLGSLHSIAPSDKILSEPTNSDLHEEDEAIEDDAELDSLDSHLPEFLQRGQQGGLQSTTILPGHDGLGSFGLDTQGLATEMQETMYQFERYNPRRVKRRRESLELGQLVLETEEAQEASRRRRIEEWRLEQSRILLQEIHQETRRRRDSTVSALAKKLKRSSQLSTEVEAEEATMSNLGNPTPDVPMAGTEWHEQDASELGSGAGKAEGDRAISWTQITRKVIRDLIGIDDRLLCILFGEALPDDLDLELGSDELATTPKANAPVAIGTNDGDTSWQLRILDKVATELGNLVSQLSAHPHPGAFSTYTQVQQMPIPYAGLPAIPEGADHLTRPTVQDAPAHTGKEDARNDTGSRRFSDVEGSTISAMPQFQPTLQTIPHTRPMNIHRTRSSDRPVEAPASENQQGTFTQQEWEQDLDIKLVFRYLRNRFTSSRAAVSNPPPHAQSQQHAFPSPASQDVAAARVRQHHPLVRGAHPHPRRSSFKVGVSTATMSQLQRHPSTCASQSTKRSGRRGSISVSSRHSSRHYWDIGAAGSVGTGSMIASTGPMGSWGEA
ncbi:hypothetical protein SLS53_003415 [Cytospora paraplurivora]|uniref:Uncharacterized protein n=1 Tax=Cytospora paraplurivora TaxID=2898453 RepID=A0AAN9YJC4_9PEZI